MEAKSHASRYGAHLPALWQFWGQLRTLAAAAQPNAAHLALTRASARARAAGGFLTALLAASSLLQARPGRAR